MDIESRLALRGRPATTPDLATVRGVGDATAHGRIRCPHCGWQPARSSRWSCVRHGTPEPPFDACGTVWNTFDTRGRCPGCAHQWIWTTCLRCGTPAEHEAWYEQPPGGRS